MTIHFKSLTAFFVFIMVFSVLIGGIDLHDRFFLLAFGVLTCVTWVYEHIAKHQANKTQKAKL